MSDDVMTSPRLRELLRMRRFIDQDIAAERQRIAHQEHSDLVRAAADLYGATVEEIRSNDRSAHVSKARMTSAWLLRMTGLSFPDISERLNCHHTTAMHACRTIEANPARLALARGLLEQEDAA